MRINARITFALGVMLAIIMLVSISSVLSLNLVTTETESTLESTEIERLVLEMNAGLQEARRLESTFFLQYQLLGVSEARQQYSLPAVTRISQVITLSNQLRDLLERAGARTTLEERGINLDLYLVQAERNAEVFFEAGELISQLADQENGLETQIDQTADLLQTELEATDQPEFLLLFNRMRFFEQSYLVSRQRPRMQSAFNVAFELENQITESEDLSAPQEERLIELLGNYQEIANQIIDIDVQLRSIYNDFDLQDETINPISEQLIAFANEEVTQSRREIDRASDLTPRVVIALSLTALLLLFVIGFGLNRTITQRIVNLRGVASELQAGNLDTRAQTKGLDEIGELALTFNNMAQQLQESFATLERRVAERTRDLQVAAEVSQQVTKALDLDRLLAELAELTRDGFDLYHVSVFLYDEEQNNLRLAAGSGDAGQKMLEAGKAFMLDEGEIGLVPLAARTMEPIVINNVEESEQHFANPLLPETRSEVSLPMQMSTPQGNQLVGVLDLQGKQIDRFSEDDIKVLTSLAEQIAIAVRNAQLFTQVQKTLQEAENARDEAQRANEVKSWFLASMSHELRTPLNGILNFTGFVADGMLGPINDKQSEVLKDAISNGEHLLALINDVLDISKIESGSLKLFVEEEVDVKAILESVVSTGKGLLKNKGVEISLDIDDDLPSILADRRRIQQIALNIVSNACKFTEEGHIKVTARKNHHEILISFEDTGPGIAQDDQESVFETFRQTETGLREGGGTGLGMPISRRLAEAHGGRLWIESTLGEGSTFHVALPITSDILEPTRKRELRKT